MKHDQIALQLYTVRDLTKIDLRGTLREVAAAGYRSVELAAMPPTTPGELGRLLGDTGLRAIASHEGIGSMRADAGAVVDRLADLGCPRVILPGMERTDRSTPDAVRRFADDVNGFVRIVADRGLRLGYHNHDWEFAPLDGTTTWDILLEHLAPEVDLEIDVYWAAVAGRDPATIIRQTDGRVRLLHMKDLITEPEPHDAPPGEGQLDFPGIVAAGREANVEWYVAEQDDPQSPIDDIGRAHRYLASLAD
ncbi:MAG: sugar phosphate isomerase/epimerase family protein [Chloroflexota bacterium]